MSSPSALFTTAGLAPGQAAPSAKLAERAARGPGVREYLPFTCSVARVCHCNDPRYASQPGLPTKLRLETASLAVV